MASSTPDPDLRALQKAWSPDWEIWRARRSSDPPGVNEGEFVATRMDENAGPDRTVMRPNAEQLDAALRKQRDLAARGVLPFSTSFWMRG